MLSKLDVLSQNIQTLLGEYDISINLSLSELTVLCPSPQLIDVLTLLRDCSELAFEQCIDLCGVDYSCYKETACEGPRFAVVYHLLSLRHNWRVRLKTFAQNDDFPVVPSVIALWNSVNWYEREAFDLFGIIFDGHPDLRRLLTDYGFVGYPFRKDFPLTGYVEMRYDAAQQRVIYQPITINPRDIVPRIIREEQYGG